MPPATPVGERAESRTRIRGVHGGVQTQTQIQNRKKQKSRSGCQTCKARRLKCDETRPECRNCVKKGVACPGYLLVLRWTTKYERVHEPAVLEPVHFNQLASAASDSIKTKEKEKEKEKVKEKAAAAKRASSSESRVTAQQSREGSTAGHSSGPDNTELENVDLGGMSFSPGYDASLDPTLVAEVSSSGILDSFSLPSASPPRSLLPEASSPSQFLPMINNPESWLDGSDQSVEDETQHVAPRRRRSGMAFPASHLDIMARRRGSVPVPAPQTLVDIPTFLIDHWFKSVCSSWSAFDSHANPYRKLASSLWGNSMSVFYALQSMAAASLVENLPHIRQAALQARRLAIESLQNELRVFRLDTGNGLQFPRSLLLSLFCMSSSLCWMDTRQLGLQLLRQARVVLGALNRKTTVMEVEDREFLDFFNGCLTYEEMLRSIVSDDEADIGSLARWKPTSLSQVSVSPHAWTGVSPSLLRLFGKTMVLCRRSRNRLRQNANLTEKVLLEAMADYREAADIEEVLLDTEVPNLIEAGETAEETVLRAHLRDAAEAFRLCSLHQLYQTFPDVLVKRLPDQVDANGVVPYSGWLGPLALHITQILQRIPPSSSMRCLQPLLCLSAGSGLRYDNPVPVAVPADLGFDGDAVSLGDTLTDSLENPLGEFPTSSVATDFNFDDPDFMSSFTSTFGTDFQQGLSAPSTAGSYLTQSDVDTSRARIFIQERLSRLEELLPPKPIVVAKQLLREVWSAYDAETESSCRTHWLDVMDRTGLQSLFG